MRWLGLGIFSSVHVQKCVFRAENMNDKDAKTGKRRFEIDLLF